jgi:hypothetical protein
MAKRPQHIDDIFENWPYEFGEVAARKVRGKDGRPVLQLRLDMGLMQMEIDGRPDGVRPEGFPTYYDYLLSLSFEEGQDFELDGERCMEIDREFVQFYHRRMGWLALRDFRRAMADAEHTLALMDFSSAHAPEEQWALMHEQYRPFVIFHHTQAAALAEIDDLNPDNAVAAIDAGLAKMEAVFEHHDAEEEFGEDELVQRLREMKDALANHYEVEQPLSDQLADAIAHERYELAAELRDKIARHSDRRV